MLTVERVNEIGKEMERLYCFKYSPMAIKLVNRDEVPEGCTQPSAEGNHYALCQVLSFVRRTRNPIVMFPEDHWCLWPLINLRSCPITEEDEKVVGCCYFIKDPEVSYNHFHNEYPYIKEELKKDGLAIAPLCSCTFVPDAIMIYADPSQLRQLLMSAKWHSGNIATSSFDTCDSCGAALLPILNGEKLYNVSIPDAGEFERGLCGENEMIFTLSVNTLEDFVNSGLDLEKKGFGIRQLTYDLHPDYQRPAFYNNMFKKWGLATSDFLWGEPGKR